MFLVVLLCASAIAASHKKLQKNGAKRFRSWLSIGQKDIFKDADADKNKKIARNRQNVLPLSTRNRLRGLHKGSQKLRNEDSCDTVCNDLPKRDNEPVCMMYSRFKKAYQFFMNECHARRSICKENLFLHQVHMSKCVNSNQYYMPVN